MSEPDAGLVMSLDLGSRHVGLVVLAPTLPARILGYQPITVDADDLDPAEAWILGTLDVSIAWCKDRALPPPRVVIEWGRFFVKAADTPQKTAAKASAMGEARDPMICLRDRVEKRCRMLGLRVTRISVNSWRARIGCGKDRTDAGVRVALARHTALDALPSEHARDAAGAAIAVLLAEAAQDAPKPPRKRGRRNYVPSPATLARRARDAALDALCDAAAITIAAATPTPPPLPTIAESRASVAALPQPGYSGKR